MMNSSPMRPTDSALRIFTEGPFLSEKERVRLWAGEAKARIFGKVLHPSDTGVVTLFLLRPENLAIIFQRFRSSSERPTSLSDCVSLQHSATLREN